MGSPLRLTVCPDGSGPPPGAAAAAWDDVVAEFEASEQAMSRFRETSELTKLNRAAGTGRIAAVGRRLERAIVAADRARRATGGRFDPHVLADLDRLGYRGAPLPAGVVLADGCPNARLDGMVRVACRVAPGRLRIDRPLDLGGIGKGLALRWAATLLDRRCVPSYLIEAGGDLVARGSGPDGGGWRVGVEDPAGADGSPLAVLTVEDGAVATSSVGVNAWIADGRRVHHLIDPATGQPGGEGLLAVTVAGRDPAWSEVWSKTLFLAGRAGIAGLARARGLAAWWVGVDGSIEMTPAARARTTWVAAEDGPPSMGLSADRTQVPFWRSRILYGGIDKVLTNDGELGDTEGNRACQDLTGPQPCSAPGGAVWRSVLQPK